MTPVKVLIADDQPVVRHGFALFLADHPRITVVGQAESGRAALAACQRLTPDVVLMDIRMPGGDGLAATRDVLALPTPPKVIVVTTFDLDEYLFTALDLGAAGFLLKDTDPTELAAAVTTVADGGIALSPRLAPRLVAEFARRRPQPQQRQLPAAHPLTPREAQIAAMVGEGLTNQQAARALGVEESTIKTHVANIAKKLGVPSRVHIAVWAHNNGLAPPRIMRPRAAHKESTKWTSSFGGEVDPVWWTSLMARHVLAGGCSCGSQTQELHRGVPT